MERQIVFGSEWVTVDFPDEVEVVSPGLASGLDPAPDLEAEVRRALDEPLDTPPLREQVRTGSRVTVAFDDATVPCYAPLWSSALPLIAAELESGGVAERDISFVCANALHRKNSLDELAKFVGDDFVRRHGERISCHDAEDVDALVHLGTTDSGYDVELNRCVADSDLLVYLNCSTMRGFSGGWKSVCVGLSSYRSIRHHHTPDIMSMSYDRNRMHEMLDEMGARVEAEFGDERVFKLETVLAGPMAVHRIFSGSTGAARRSVLEVLRAHQPARRDLATHRFDVVIYGVPDWSPYAAFAQGNPILDMISTGLGYLGGMVSAIGVPGCTVIMATPVPWRWDDVHHASYREVWDTVLPETTDPDDARLRFEPVLAERADYIEAYRNRFSFHPVHAVMALYPLKRLRHAGRVIVAGALDEALPRHCGFDYAPSVEAAIGMARDLHGPDASMALVENPPAFNRS